MGRERCPLRQWRCERCRPYLSDLAHLAGSRQRRNHSQQLPRSLAVCGAIERGTSQSRRMESLVDRQDSSNPSSSFVSQHPRQEPCNLATLVPSKGSRLSTFYLL